jgi:hypothetical protein
MIHNHWLSITHHDSQPLVQHYTPWKSWIVMLCQRLWIVAWYCKPVVVNHGVLCWASGCESWCVLLSQWLLIMVCFTEPVNTPWLITTGSVNHTMIHNHWLSIAHHDSQPLARNTMPRFTTFGSVCYTEAVVVNHGVLYWSSGCESWCVFLSQWLWIMGYYTERVVVNHGGIYWASGCIAHHDSQPLAQHDSPWFTATGSS